MIKKMAVVVILAASLLVITGGTALACGDTPGFCPNPPDDSSNGQYVVGAGGDWH